MISFITGKVIAIDLNNVTIQTNDIGYSIYTPDPFKYKLEDQISLHTYMNVRENEISLWGFPTPNELSIFKLLIGVSGVGPKTALSLIEHKGVEAIVRAIIQEDDTQMKVSGIGNKTAQKIIIELKGKIAKLESSLPKSKAANLEENINVSLDIYQESEAALVALGYKQSDISDAIKKLKLHGTKIETSQDLIKILLKSL